MEYNRETIQSELENSMFYTPMIEYHTIIAGFYSNHADYGNPSMEYVLEYVVEYCLNEYDGDIEELLHWEGYWDMITKMCYYYAEHLNSEEFAHLLSDIYSNSDEYYARNMLKQFKDHVLDYRVFERTMSFIYGLGDD
jgi:hypothetical protein